MTRDRCFPAGDRWHTDRSSIERGDAADADEEEFGGAPAQKRADCHQHDTTDDEDDAAEVMGAEPESIKLFPGPQRDETILSRGLARRSDCRRRRRLWLSRQRGRRGRRGAPSTPPGTA